MLSSFELFESAKRDFHNELQKGRFTETDVNSFINERVLGARVNGVDIITLDFAHKEKNIHPVMEAYIRSPRTRVVVSEYFYPELKINAEKAGLSILLNSKFLKLIYRHHDRLNRSRKLAGICQEAGKPVAVTDIANRPLYFLEREAFRWSPYCIAFLGEKIIKKYAIFPAIKYANIAWIINYWHSMIKGKGIFNREHIPSLDKFVLDFEQARRLYLAKGVEHLTAVISPSSMPRKKDSQIVALYPRAHGMRMVDILVNSHPKLDKVKNAIYKTFAPYLDYSVRIWKWQDSEQSLLDSRGSIQANWRLVYNYKILI